MMTERAQRIMKAYEAEDTYNFPNDGVAAAIRAIADRFPTEKHPYDALYEIANELEALK